MGIYDVPAGMLIEEAAKDFKTRIKKPAFTDYAKTGAHKERAPNNPDWFYTRMAAVLYRAYKEGNLGTGRLRTYFGGRKNRGVKPERKVKASGKILRTCLQMLEKEGFVKKEKNGRKITGKGEKFLFEKSAIAQKIFEETKNRKKVTIEEDAKRRIANRAKLEQQKTQAPELQKGAKPQPRPVQAQPVPVKTRQAHADPTDSAKAQEAHPAQHNKGNDDGRAGPEAKKA